ncbi:MAG: helix-turn-helix transcriptional regulator [Planctomycetia bacterium]|nr:helix-turn-helix transcriptional regulator [Planctomycetia bacterium]
MSIAPVTLNGKAYVILERDEYESMKRGNSEPSLPEFPKRGKHGYPAAEYMRVSIARDIIQDRRKAGLTQKELANLAGIRVETLCRIETGKHTPSVTTIERIERALLKIGKKKRTQS